MQRRSARLRARESQSSAQASSASTWAVLCVGSARACAAADSGFATSCLADALQSICRSSVSKSLSVTRARRTLQQYDLLPCRRALDRSLLTRSLSSLYLSTAHTAHTQLSSFAYELLNPLLYLGYVTKSMVTQACSNIKIVSDLRQCTDVALVIEAVCIERADPLLQAPGH